MTPKTCQGVFKIFFQNSEQIGVKSGGYIVNEVFSLDRWGEKEVYCAICLRNLPPDWDYGDDLEAICNSCREYGGLNPSSPMTRRGRMLIGAKRRAKKAGVPFAITVDDIGEIPTHCPVLGIKLQTNTKAVADASPSLDRIEPALGYVKGNVAVMSKRANTIKSNGTAEEHEKIAAWMRAHAATN